MPRQQPSPGRRGPVGGAPSCKSPVRCPLRVQVYKLWVPPLSVQTRGNHWLFLSCIYVSLPFSLPSFPSLKLINEK